MGGGERGGERAGERAKVRHGRGAGGGGVGERTGNLARTSDKPSSREGRGSETGAPEGPLLADAHGHGEARPGRGDGHFPMFPESYILMFLWKWKHYICDSHILIHEGAGN